MPEDISKAAENVYDGWYSSSDRIDWEDFIDRLEKYADVDLGSDLLSPQIKFIQRHIRAYRKLE